MLRHFTAGSLVLVAALALVSVQADETAAEGEEKKFAAKCPVSGAAAKKEQSTRHLNGHVYFCCEKCKAAYAENKMKYREKANAQLVATGQYIQEKCPLSGGPMKTESKLEDLGVTVKFCCDNCKKKFDEAEGAAKLRVAFTEEAFKKGFRAKRKGKKAE